jgi:hypothetical protein
MLNGIDDKYQKWYTVLVGYQIVKQEVLLHISVLQCVMMSND